MHGLIKLVADAWGIRKHRQASGIWIASVGWGRCESFLSFPGWSAPGGACLSCVPQQHPGGTRSAVDRPARATGPWAMTGRSGTILWSAPPHGCICGAVLTACICSRPTYLFEMLQTRTFVQQFGYRLMKILLVTFFPHLKLLYRNTARGRTRAGKQPQSSFSQASEWRQPERAALEPFGHARWHEEGRQVELRKLKYAPCWTLDSAWPCSTYTVLRIS